MAATRPLEAVIAEPGARGVALRGGIRECPAARLAIALDLDEKEPLLARVLDSGLSAEAA